MLPVSRTLAVSRRLVTAALFALAPAALLAQPSASTPVLTPLFGLPWGTNVDSLQGAVQSLGWEFVRVDDDGDYAFRTRIDGEDAMVFATFGTNGLTRVLVSVAPHPAAMITYEHVADSLRRHFGPAVLSSHDGQTPMPPAASMITANAWQGVLMGLRRDGRILVLLTCPESSPRLPVKRGPVT